MVDRPNNVKKWEVICNIEVAQILLLKEQKTSIMQKAVWIKRLIEKTFFLSVKTRNIKSLSCKKIIAQSKDLYLKIAKMNENALTDRR